MAKNRRTGRPPEILRKGGPMADRTKYNRKRRTDEMLVDYEDRIADSEGEESPAEGESPRSGETTGH